MCITSAWTLQTLPPPDISLHSFPDVTSRPFSFLPSNSIENFLSNITRSPLNAISELQI